VSTPHTQATDDDDPFAAISNILDEEEDGESASGAGELDSLEFPAGHLSDARLAEQRAVVLALQKAQQRVRDLPGEGVAPVRDELAKVLADRKIQPDDPFWALVDLFALLFERFGERTNEVVSSACEVTEKRLQLDEQFLEYIPLMANLNERSRAASETCVTHVEGLREELEAHRAELGQFVSGVSAAFREFSKASDRVVNAGEHALFSQVGIPFVALLAGVIGGLLLARL
jgi:hypothetical protein